MGTKIDPQLCRADRLVGHVLGAVGTLPDIFVEIEISFYLFRRLLGVRTEGDKKGAKVRSDSSPKIFDTTYSFSVKLEVTISKLIGSNPMIIMTIN